MRNPILVRGSWCILFGSWRLQDPAQRYSSERKANWTMPRLSDPAETVPCAAGAALNQWRPGFEFRPGHQTGY